LIEQRGDAMDQKNLLLQSHNYSQLSM